MFKVTQLQGERKKWRGEGGKDGGKKEEDKLEPES